MPKLHRKRSLLAKIEGSYGSDPTATGSANYVEVVDLEVEPVASDEVGRVASEQENANFRLKVAFQSTA